MSYRTSSGLSNTSSKRNKHNSIFDIPSPTDPERIQRAKFRSEMTNNYRSRIREIYHQTDYLIDWSSGSSIEKPFEQTSRAAVLAFPKSGLGQASTIYTMKITKRKPKDTSVCTELTNDEPPITNNLDELNETEIDIQENMQNVVSTCDIQLDEEEDQNEKENNNSCETENIEEEDINEEKSQDTNSNYEEDQDDYTEIE